MSYLVARMQKMKAGNLGGAYKHNERIFSNHSNKDIDTSRSHLNYELTDRDRSVSYEKQIKSYIEENKVSKRATRSDAVLCDEWIVTSDSQFFERLNSQETREFFETAKDFFAERYGLENIAYASVHLDEKTPHMHLGIVPMRHGKLSSKAMFDREELKDIQAELPRYMASHGFDLERGLLGSERKHKTVAEFKQEMASKELGQELVEKYGAPTHFEEVRQDFHSFEDYLGAQEYPTNWEIFRETTLQEKIDWVEKNLAEDMDKLKLSKNALEGRISDLEVEVGVREQELAEINSRASESLSELSEVEGYINDLADRKNRLESQIGGLESEKLKLRQQIGGLKEIQTTEVELRNIKPKKSLFGQQEHVELSLTQFEDLKGLVARSRIQLQAMQLENLRLKERVPDKARQNAFEARLERAREKVHGNVQESLERENKALRGQLSIATQQNQRMAQKLRELMPRPAFEKMMQELQAIKPIFGVIKKALEKGLGLER